MTKTKSFAIGAGIVTGLLIAGFLSGKIIEIPHQGTPKGGLFAMTGIGIILILMFVTSSLLYFLNRKFSRNKKDI